MSIFAFSGNRTKQFVLLHYCLFKGIIFLSWHILTGKIYLYFKSYAERS